MFLQKMLEVCFLLTLFGVTSNSQLQGLAENAPCGNAGGICRRLKDCPVVGDPRQSRPLICSFLGREPVVCCPPSRALEMCLLYDRMSCSGVELARRRRETEDLQDQSTSRVYQEQEETVSFSQIEDVIHLEGVGIEEEIKVDDVESSSEQNFISSTISQIWQGLTTTLSPLTSSEEPCSRTSTTPPPSTTAPSSTTSFPSTTVPSSTTSFPSTTVPSSTTSFPSTTVPSSTTSKTTRPPTTTKLLSTSRLPSTTRSQSVTTTSTTTHTYYSLTSSTILPPHMTNLSENDDGATRMLSPGFSLASVSDNDLAEKKIVGGTVANPRELPYMALIGFGTGANKEWSCGASIVSENFVMSAAHCAQNAILGPARWARVAELDLVQENTPHLDIPIIARFVHPGYKEPAVYNDIALFRLGTRLTFSSWVQPLCLQVAPNIQATRGVAAGWGRTDFVGETSERLLKVDLSLVETAKCRTQLGRAGRFLPQGVNLETMICAGEAEGGKDTCTGDSGGPLVVQGIGQCIRTQIGVVSFGRQCAMPNTPGIYTKVSSFISWIESIVWPV